MNFKEDNKMNFKKGDRVSIPTKGGEIVYGVVVRGGSKKVTVTIDGNEQQASGSPACFQHSDHPLPKDKPNSMDKWGVTSYKEIEGHGDTATFHAKLTLDGKIVGNAMNDGWGGCNCYHFKDSEIEKQFYSDCKAWCTQFGYADMLEPDSTWVDWYVTDRPYGVTAETVIQNFKKEIDILLKK